MYKLAHKKWKRCKKSTFVQILDPAVVPSRKNRPPRKLIVLISAVASVIATLIMVLMLEYWRNIPNKNEEDWEKISKIRQLIIGK